MPSPLLIRSPGRQIALTPTVGGAADTSLNTGAAGRVARLLGQLALGGSGRYEGDIGLFEVSTPKRHEGYLVSSAWRLVRRGWANQHQAQNAMSPPAVQAAADRV